MILEYLLALFSSTFLSRIFPRFVRGYLWIRLSYSQVCLIPICIITPFHMTHGTQGQRILITAMLKSNLMNL